MLQVLSQIRKHLPRIAGMETAVLTATKRDTHAIWFKHVPAELSRQFKRLESNQTIDLAINDQMATWARMKESPVRPTRGPRLEDGRPVWECIRMGDTFTLGSVVPVRTSNDAIAVALLPRHRRSSKPMFDGYEYADFSGARDTAIQRRTIRMAFCTRWRKARFGQALLDPRDAAS